MSGNKGIDWDEVARRGDLDRLTWAEISRREGVSESSVRGAAKWRRCTACGKHYPRIDKACQHCGVMRVAEVPKVPWPEADWSLDDGDIAALYGASPTTAAKARWMHDRDMAGDLSHDLGEGQWYRTGLSAPVPPGMYLTEHVMRLDRDGEVFAETVRMRPEPRPQFEAVPEGFKASQITSFLTNGRITNQWVQSRFDGDDDPAAWIREDVRQLVEPIRGIVLPAEPPKGLDPDHCWQLLWGDPHFGMYAWALEVGGSSWDLDIAERIHLSASADLIRSAPAVEKAVLCTIGDTSHGDNNKNATPQSGHALDIDTRWRKVTRAITRTLRATIDMMLEKFGTVEVKIVPGNHDPHTSATIQDVIDAIYENEPRVTVDTTPEPFLWWRFGENMFLYAHGDGAKLEELPSIMSCDRSKWWGECRHRHAYSGHIHHKKEKVVRGREFAGASTESLATMAGRDFWHHWKGYRAAQKMKADTWHRVGGRRGTNEVTPSFLEQMRDAA